MIHLFMYLCYDMSHLCDVVFLETAEFKFKLTYLLIKNGVHFFSFVPVTLHLSCALKQFWRRMIAHDLIKHTLCWSLLNHLSVVCNNLVIHRVGD